jgi:hypothetical protein
MTKIPKRFEDAGPMRVLLGVPENHLSGSTDGS